MAAESMRFPETVDEFMEQYKIVDTEQVYTNGMDLVPIFRMQQWFEHLPAADVRPVAEISDTVDEVLDFLNDNSNCMPYHIYSTLFDLVSGICPDCGADIMEAHHGSP